jgi:uncharacterized membrane protein YbhN (UPF0104 family)
MIDSTPSFARIISAFILAVVMLLAYTRWQTRNRKDFSITRTLKMVALTLAFGTAPLVAVWWYLFPRKENAWLAATFGPTFGLTVVALFKGQRIRREKSSRRNTPPHPTA